MPHTLRFDSIHEYNSSLVGIEVPTVLMVGRHEVTVFPKLDTGAANCVFERRYAEPLGLDVETGRLQKFQTAAGTFAAFEHEVTIRTLGVTFSAIVYFAQDFAFQKNVLGRTGWPDRVRLGIVDYEQRLYLSAYDE